uniref:LRRCT domain-containing protein n=1 Tax=Oryzias latipes TaxID=8090 RepID=A0A3P9KWV7_ORYLA
MTSFFVLAFLLMAFSCHGSLACPEFCKCSPGGSEVVCSEVPLATFPSDNLPNSTTILTIQLTNITSITEEHLKVTPLLQELHLYGNQLQSLSPHLLRGLPHLLNLDLTENKLRHLPANVFSHAPLHGLVLKNNLIEEARGDWLPENSSLTWLDLSGNLLTRIPTALLQRLPNLENLDLSNNHLQEIPVHCLDGLAKLERLNLQDNKLHSLDASSFQSMPSLTVLFLARNKLSHLPGNLFHGLSRLTHLSLYGNQLSRIPVGLFDPLASLEERSLDLTGNPLVCEGKTEYLCRWYEKNKGVFLSDSMSTCRCPQPGLGPAQK